MRASEVYDLLFFVHIIEKDFLSKVEGYKKFFSSPSVKMQLYI